MLMMTARVYVATDTHSHSHSLTHSGEKEAISFDRMGIRFWVFLSLSLSVR